MGRRPVPEIINQQLKKPEMKLKSIIRSFALVTGVAAAIGLAPAPRAQTIETILDGTSFSSVTALEAEWNYGYPWGDTHNAPYGRRAVVEDFEGHKVELYET